MADTFVGGSETSTNAIGYGVKLLVENPEAWAMLKADPDKHLRTFCEEVLRLEGPVQGLFRTAAKDIELHGVTIPAGPCSTSATPPPTATSGSSSARKQPGPQPGQARAAPGLRLRHPPLPRRALGPARDVLGRSRRWWTALTSCGSRPAKTTSPIAPNFALRALRGTAHRVQGQPMRVQSASGSAGGAGRLHRSPATGPLPGAPHRPQPGLDRH